MKNLKCYNNFTKHAHSLVYIKDKNNYSTLSKKAELDANLNNIQPGIFKQKFKFARTKGFLSIKVYNRYNKIRFIGSKSIIRYYSAVLTLDEKKEN